MMLWYHFSVAVTLYMNITPMYLAARLWSEQSILVSTSHLSSLPPRCMQAAYSPNSLRTRFNTLSFSGSYGWSLDGISRSDGNAAVYDSTRCLILSAMCWLIKRIAMSLRSVVNLSKAASMAEFSVLASTTRKFFWLSGGCVTC